MSDPKSPIQQLVDEIVKELNNPNNSMPLDDAFFKFTESDIFKKSILKAMMMPFDINNPVSVNPGIIMVIKMLIEAIDNGGITFREVGDEATVCSVIALLLDTIYHGKLSGHGK